MGVVALVLGVIAARAIIGFVREGPRGTERLFYCDTVSQRVFVDRASRVPPFTSPDGHEAVRVHFFTCGECNESDRFVGFYEKFSASVRERLAAASDPFEAMQAAGNQGLLQSLDGQTWFPAGGPESATLLERLRCPDGSTAEPCVAE
jgi:hypothetical protein